MPRWLPRVLARIHRLAAEGKVQFTEKAFEELRALPLGISSEDACHILENLTASGMCGTVGFARDGGVVMCLQAPDRRNRALREGCTAGGLRGDLVSRGGWQ